MYNPAAYLATPETYGTDTWGNIAKGYQMAQLPAQMKNQKQMDALKLAMTQNKAKYEPQMSEADLQNKLLSNTNQQMQNQAFPQDEAAKRALLAAQTQKANQPAQQNQPNMSGDVANAVAVVNMEKQYGSNDPRVIAAKTSLLQQQANNKSMIDSRDAYAGSIDKRSASPIGKLDLEAQEVEEGFLPGTKNSDNPVQLTPEEQQKFKDRYGLAVLKSTTDPAARQKTIYATNLEKTLDMINPDDLFVYAGPSGSAQYALDSAKVLNGTQPERYNKYQAALTLANASGKQYRQFVGDSIQPAAMEKIEQLTNPVSPFKDKKAAMAAYDSFKSMANNEVNTYYSANQSPDAFLGKQSNPQGSPQANTNPQAQATQQKMYVIRDENGTEKTVTAAEAAQHGVKV